MSTDYYRFNKPITSIRIESEGSHDKVSVWVDHAASGTLVVNKGQGYDILKMFVSSEKVLHSYAGPGATAFINKCVLDLSDDEYVISDSGRISMVRDVLSERTLKGA